VQRVLPSSLRTLAKIFVYSLRYLLRKEINSYAAINVIVFFLWIRDWLGLSAVLFFVIGAFGESLSFAAQKKVTKEKGRQTPSLRGFCQASAQRS
jgi:hypothetical protein